MKEKMKAGARAGFTIVELMVVIAVIMILIGISLTVLGKAKTAAQRRDTESMLKEITTACEAYRADFRAYPWQGLQGVFMGSDTSVIVLRTLSPTRRFSSEEEKKYFEGGVEKDDGVGVENPLTPIQEGLTPAEQAQVWNPNALARVYLPIAGSWQRDDFPFRGNSAYKKRTLVNVFHKRSGEIESGGLARCDGSFRFRTTSFGGPRVWTEIVDETGMLTVIDNGQGDANAVKTANGEISNAHDYRNFNNSGVPQPGYNASYP